MKKKIRKGTKIVKKHGKKISIFIVVLVIYVIYYFWNDIISAIYFLIEGLKKNWKSILLGLISYKVILVNLSKRYAINKGVERFKKSLIYSEMDELIHVGISIISSKIKRKIKKAENLPFIGWFISLIVHVLSWVFLAIAFMYSMLFTVLGKLLITKVLSAQFWTAILVWLSNIPGFFTFLGVWFWIWLETKFPFIPKTYFWLSMKIRIILDPAWDRIEPILNNIWDYILKVELRILTPIGAFIDNLEMKVICKIKEYIYYQKGEKNYNRYMKLVSRHNAKQLEKKKKREKKKENKTIFIIKKKSGSFKKT